MRVYVAGATCHRCSTALPQGRPLLALAIQVSREKVNEWSYVDDPHGYCHDRPVYATLAKAGTSRGAAAVRTTRAALRTERTASLREGHPLRRWPSGPLQLWTRCRPRQVGRGEMTTSRGTWKALERRIASLLGGERVPVTGRHDGREPDIRHPLYAIEVKLRAERPKFLDAAMAQAKRALRPGQIPVVVVAGKGQHLRKAFVVVELGDFVDWFGSSSDEGGAPPGYDDWRA